MKRVPLTQGQFALVDDEDFERVSQNKWHAVKIRGEYYYARHAWRYLGRTKSISIQHFILGIKSSQLVDHIDGNGLNNQRSNLRPASKFENLQNRKVPRNNKTGFKGVSIHHRRPSRFVARIVVNWKWITLGSFDDPKKAAHAYDVAALKHFGQFARTNSMMGLI